MRIHTTDGQTIKAMRAGKELEIGPKPKQFGDDEARFILSPYFARHWSANVAAVAEEPPPEDSGADVG